MKNLNLNEVNEVSEYKRLGTGGFICVITKVEDVAESEYLMIQYDIAEGEFKDYYKELMDKKSFWGGKFVRSYKEKALPFFKSFITSVEGSNSGFKFDSDESKLVGKKIGLVIGEEEYRKSDGTIKTRLYVDKANRVETIKKGEFIVPELKRLAGFKEDAVAFTAIDDESSELPF